MVIDLIATVAVALGVASLIYVANHLGLRLFGRGLAKWVMPAGIGAAIIGFAIWNEYTWYPRMRAALPEGMVVVSAPPESTPFRPWSYAVPIVSRFIVLDRAGSVPSAADAGIFVANAVILQRWHATKTVAQAFDCASGARADLVGGAALAEDGTLKGTEWQRAEGDPLVEAACGGG